MEVKMDYISILKGYVEGTVTVDELKKIYFSDMNLQKYLNDNLPTNIRNYAGVRVSNGDINQVFKHFHWGTAFANSSLQDYIGRWLQGNDINFNPTPVYKDRFKRLLEIMPDYIEGEQAESLIEELIQSVPEDLPKTKRKKLIKEKIKEAFHLEGRKYPHWAQSTDWPFSKCGKPLKYISQKTDGDLVELTFQDVDTGEIILVEDFY